MEEKFNFSQSIRFDFMQKYITGTLLIMEIVESGFYCYSQLDDRGNCLKREYFIGNFGEMWCKTASSNDIIG